MKDFFISYTGTDSKYAEWVAQLLEENNYSVIIQAWDFRPGDNFVSKINESLIECKKLIVILSNNYLSSKWCEAEWTSKLTEQIKLNERRIIPIRIEPIDLKGLFSPIVYIDIVDKTEQEAALEILNGISETHPRIAINKFPSYYNVEHLQIDNDYYVSQTDIIFIKTCKCKILKDGFNKIHNRITWFADEKIELISLTKNVEIEILNLRDTNLNYNVVFNHTFKRDEIVEYRIKAVLSNENKHFNNFFSSEIITPIKDLNIHLNLIDLNVDKIYTQKISSSPLNARTEKPNEIDFFSPYHWHIPNPEIHFEYKIYW